MSKQATMPRQTFQMCDHCRGNEEDYDLILTLQQLDVRLVEF